MQSSDGEFQSEISFAEGDFVDLGLQKMQVAVLPLVQVLGTKVRALGTCFSITNDGLCMTARHVIEEGLALVEGARSTQIDPDVDGYLGALYLSDEPGAAPGEIMGGILPMHSINCFSPLDIALIKLNLPTNTETGKQLFFPLHPLRMTPPRPGDLFFGLGYREMSWELDAEGSGPLAKQKFSATRGHIEEVHLEGRDRVMLPFPCFRSSARMDAGMSGGPLFDEQGRVFGVVCSSFSGEYSTSYGSLLAPAMAMTLQVRRPDGTEGDAFLWELVEGGAIMVGDRDEVVGVRNGDEMTLSFAKISMKARLGS